MFSTSPVQIPFIDKLVVADAPAGKVTRYWLKIASDGMGVPIHLPLLVAKGKSPGKTMGITAAVHGNELNGISVIQRLFNELDVENIKGTVVGVPVVNVPSFLRRKRRFPDGTDLNHIMPGKADGNVSQVYAWRLIDRLVNQFDYLIDLHTASNGRVNSYYIRADLQQPIVKKMALLQNPQIIVHNPPNDGTLRGMAAEMGIAAITLEVGDPNLFQKGMIRDGLTGIHNVLAELGIAPGTVEEADTAAVICSRSFWMYTDIGGFLTVHPKITHQVKKGELIATLRNVFGDVLKTYKAPQDGVVIGRSTNPVNQTGGRILHLGVISKNQD
jgi:hypothetical protein